MNLERAMKACLLAMLLALGVGKAPLAAAPSSFDSPSGVTLLAQGGGRYLMLWDPIYRDDLLGYSVWLRKPGDAEFMRLSVPVKIGKEVKKQPLTPDSKVVLALGRERDDLELTVVAEYEDGSSARAPVVRSAGARRSSAATATAAVPADAASAAAQSVSPASTVRERADALATEEQPVPTGEAPWDKEKERDARPLIAAAGTLRTKLGASFDYRHFSNGGYDVFSSLGLGGTGIDPNSMVNWQRNDVRTTLSVPLSVRYGLLPGVELWGQASYQAEDFFVGAFKVNGQDFSYIRFVHFDAGGNMTYLSNPSSTGLGDSLLGVRGQPMTGLPLVLGVKATLPTGVSRFKSMLDWFAGRGSPAGTGDGVLRLGLDVDWGLKGGPSGLSFHGGYSPSADERYRLDDGSGGPLQTQVLTRGDVIELGGAYTFPWQLVGRGGALALGLMGRSQNADRWTTDGVDQAPGIPHAYRTAYEAAAAMKLERDDQLEFSLEAFQDLPHGFETGGRLSYAMEAFGDRYTISGQFLY